MTAVIYDDGIRDGDYILSEGEGTISRDTVKLAAGVGVVKASTVLGKVADTNEYRPHDPAANDGSQVACAILYRHTPASAAPVDVVVTARQSEVKKQHLTMHPSVQTAAQRAAIYETLAHVGIIAR